MESMGSGGGGYSHGGSGGGVSSSRSEWDRNTSGGGGSGGRYGANVGGSGYFVILIVLCNIRILIYHKMCRWERNGWGKRYDCYF